MGVFLSSWSKCVGECVRRRQRRMVWGWVAVFFHLLLVLHLLGSRSRSQVKAAARVKRTIIGRYPVCPRGCTSCSPVNGCVTCESRYFMFLYRQNMRQIGICTPSCPMGYYGVRHRSYSTCNRCHIDHCQACFSRHYCTQCREPYMTFQGQCIEQCPQGLYYANYSKHCQERVDCLPGPWAQWSVCSRNGRTCGYKWGVQTRTRQILQTNSPNGQECPALSRSQRCRLANRWCSDEECNRRKRHRHRLRKYKRRRGRKRKRGRRKQGRRRRYRKKKTRSRRGRRRERNKRQRKVRQRRLCRDRACRPRNKRRRKNGCRSRRISRG